MFKIEGNNIVSLYKEQTDDGATQMSYDSQLDLILQILKCLERFLCFQT